MKKLTPEQISAEISKRNSTFKSATKSEKRILLAKDIIEQIKAKRFKVKRGVWAKFNVDKFEETDSIQRLFIEKAIPSCECCAVGSLMMSCTLFKNQEKIEDVFNEFTCFGETVFEDERKVKNGLLNIFSKTQLTNIELAFEKGRGWFNLTDQYNDYYDSEAIKTNKYVQFGKKFKDNESRLIAIMENIIENNGEFIV